MSFNDHDRDILKRLAERKAEIAALPVHREKAKLWRRVNQLDPVRPTVWITEVPWHEIDDPELRPRCHDAYAQEIETELLRELYQWDHFRVDTIVEPVLYCPIVIHDSGFGIVEESKKIYAHEGSVPSRGFVIQIQEPEDLEKIQEPVISIDHAETERRFGALNEAVGDIISVRKQGVPGRWFAPWDELVRWWGIEQAMTDLLDRPEMIHAAMDRLITVWLSRLEQWEQLDLLSSNNAPIRVGSGAYGYTDELPTDDSAPEPLTPADLWGCSTAQIFSGVSPAMHDEFALTYERRWLERFGLTYYGCCEPLHGKIEILEQIPNLRKISASPWANVAVMAEKTGGRYVISHKPNPAIVAEDDWNPSRARALLCEAVEKSNGCPMEIILKDISTMRFDPARLRDWAQIAMDVVGA